MSATHDNIWGKFLEIQDANADVERASIAISLMARGFDMAGEYSEADKLDSFRIISTALMSVFQKIGNAREFLEDEYMKAQKKGKT